MSVHLENRNYARRFGTHCAECGKKLGRYRLDGTIADKRVGFCSCPCMDAYRDKVESSSTETENAEAI